MSDDQPTADHYATLGVMPRCEHVVIRAAYLALMNRYHPDKSSQLASSGRAQAIIAAYAVLGDPETRIRYDWDRRRAAEEMARPPQARWRYTPLIAASLAVIALVAPLALIRAPHTQDTSPPAPTTARPVPAADRLLPTQAVAQPQPVARPPARTTAISLPAPDQRTQPPAIEQAAAPRPTASTVPLVVAEPARKALSTSESPRARAAKAAPASATAQCRDARPGANAALCPDDNLAALDRLGEVYYGQSWRVGDAAKRAALIVSRNGLDGRRESCRSEACLRSAYLIYMREIAAIVESKPPSAR